MKWQLCIHSFWLIHSLIWATAWTQQNATDNKKMAWKSKNFKNLFNKQERKNQTLKGPKKTGKLTNDIRKI